MSSMYKCTSPLFLAFKDTWCDNILWPYWWWRHSSSIKSQSLNPIHTSGGFRKTHGDFQHANGSLDPCQVIDTCSPAPVLYQTPEVTHNPCSSFIIEMWMRKVRRWLSLIGQHRKIWLLLCQHSWVLWWWPFWILQSINLSRCTLRCLV